MIRFAFALMILSLVTNGTDVHARATGDLPDVGKHFKGRIAYSCDGNHNDPDDWIASPVALAIFADAGLKDRLVHFDYNCILAQTDPAWEKTHTDSVLGAVHRYGYDRTRFFDCRKELDRTVDDIARVINESSADNPLWFILAGPMEVPYLGIQKADPTKRPFVHCISHSTWNDGYSKKYKYTHTKRSVIEQDVVWVQIADQNRLLSTNRYGRDTRPQEWQSYLWMRDSRNANVRWLWDRMLVSKRPDPSDAGMAWFAITGDEHCDPTKLKQLLDGHQRPAVTVRKQVRLEAENFRRLDGFAVEYLNDKKASHALTVAIKGGTRGRIATTFVEPFAPAAGRGTVDVRYFDAAGACSRFTLFVKGEALHDVWESAGEGKGWMTHTVLDVAICAGDEIAVEVEGSPARLDYVQLNFLAPAIETTYFPPPESQGGWRGLESDDDLCGVGGMDPQKLDSLREWLLQSDKRNFAATIIRHGWIVLEVERGNSAKTDARRVASCSKAVCATVLAIAAEQSQQGKTPRKMTFDDKAFDFIPWAQPLSDARKAQITVAQLLNHTSGICPEATGAPNDGTWQYILGQSGDPRTAHLAFDPGKGCGYSTMALAHAALVCETVTGKPYDQFAIEALFKPIGIEHWWFQFYEGGPKIGRHPSHGLGMPARDLARIAYCMLNHGRWEDRQVIPSWFVEQTASPTSDVKTPEMRWKLNAQVFSHGWELPARHDPKSGRSGAGIPADAREKPGSGGQIIAFVPSLDLVVTRQTGSSGDWQFEEYLRRACAATIKE